MPQQKSPTGPSPANRRARYREIDLARGLFEGLASEVHAVGASELVDGLVPQESRLERGPHQFVGKVLAKSRVAGEERGRSRLELDCRGERGLPFRCQEPAKRGRSIRKNCTGRTG